MENKKSGWIVAIVIILLLSLIGACSGGGSDSSGGRCKYCGRETNWTYRGGGYICYWCDH